MTDDTENRPDFITRILATKDSETKTTIEEQVGNILYRAEFGWDEAGALFNHISIIWKGEPTSLVGVRDPDPIKDDLRKKASAIWDAVEKPYRHDFGVFSRGGIYLLDQKDGSQTTRLIIQTNARLFEALKEGIRLLPEDGDFLTKTGMPKEFVAKINDALIVQAQHTKDMAKVGAFRSQ